MMGDMDDEMDQLVGLVTGAMERNAEDIASAYRTLYEEFRDAGFTEEQAMTLVTEGDVLDIEE